MTNSEFRKAVCKHLLSAIEPLHFADRGNLYFSRNRNTWEDILFVDLEQGGKRSFCVCIGIHLPFLQDKLRESSGPKILAPLISRYLGQTDSGGCQKWYRFFKKDELEKAVADVRKDFEVSGVPWLEKFSRLSQVCRYFFETRIARLDDGRERRANPTSWAIYGWLLQESGEAEESKKWLEKALLEFEKPHYVLKNKFFTEPVPGARALPRSPHEQFIAKLIERDLNNGRTGT